MIPRTDSLAALQESAGEAAALMRALGNEKRLLLLCLLIEEEELSAGALAEAVALSPSATSQHLARMREEGLVATRRDSQMVYYRIQDPKVRKVIETLRAIFCP